MTNQDLTFKLFDLDLTEEQIKDLKALADLKEISFQELVEGMIKEGIKEHNLDS